MVRFVLGIALLPLALASAGDRPVLVAYGDSITEGYGVDPAQSYPAQLQQALDARGRKWQVVNAGVSGDTTASALDRLARVIEHKPRVVILELGGNDGLRGIPMTTTRANMDEMIQAFKKAGARVLLVGMTLPANYGGKFLRQFDELYRDLATRHGLVLVDATKAGIVGVPGMLQQDQIHPTAAGYTQFVKYLLPFVEKAIRGR